MSNIVVTDAAEKTARHRESSSRFSRPSGKSFIGTLPALLYGVVIWYAASLLIKSLPMPHEVVVAAVGIITDPQSYNQFGATVRRVVTGFVVGGGLGAMLGVLMGWRPKVFALLSPLTMVGLAIPGAVTVITFTLILGFQESSLILALIFSVIPYSTILTATSVKGLDVGLLDMSHVFGISTWNKWRQILLPQLLPAFFAAGRNAFAISWKFVVVIEAIATSEGVGSRMLFSFMRLQTADLIAWALLFTLVMWTVETQVFARLETHLFRWKDEGRSATRRVSKK